MKFTLVFTVFLVLVSTMIASTKACICPAVYMPVCGKNGQTYSNQCRMSCAGAQLAHQGACGKNLS